MSEAMAEEQLSLTWNNHGSTYRTMFNILRQQNTLTDITLACDGRQFSAHQLVLATCSEYFQSILSSVQQCPHPIMYLRGVPAREMHAMLDFMYTGQAHVPHSQVESLLETAEALKIKGLGVVPGKDGVGDRGSYSNKRVSPTLSGGAGESDGGRKNARDFNTSIRKRETVDNMRVIKRKIVRDSLEKSDISKNVYQSRVSGSLDVLLPSPKKRNTAVLKSHSSGGRPTPTKCVKVTCPKIESRLSSEPQPRASFNNSLSSSFDAVSNFVTIKSEPICPSIALADNNSLCSQDDNCSMLSSLSGGSDRTFNCEQPGVPNTADETLAAILDIEEQSEREAAKSGICSTTSTSMSSQPSHLNNNCNDWGLVGARQCASPLLGTAAEEEDASGGHLAHGTRLDEEGVSMLAGAVEEGVGAASPLMADGGPGTALHNGGGVSLGGGGATAAATFEEMYLEAFSRGAGMTKGSVKLQLDSPSPPLADGVTGLHLSHATQELADGPGQLAAVADADSDTENRPHICPICRKRFFKAAILKRHHLAHFRPYSCDLCKRSFTRREVLAEHLLEHNGADMRLPCPVCSMTIKRKRNLQAHIKVKHPDYYRERIESKQSLF